MRTVWFVAVVALSGCSKDRPKLTQDKMPASLRSITLGKTTEAEILAAHPKAEVKPLDFNGAESHEIVITDAPNIPRMTFTTKPATKDGTVYRVSIDEANICDWVKTQVDAADGSRNCPGNRKTGMSGAESHHCMDLPDGTLVTVECRPGHTPASELELWAHY